MSVSKEEKLLKIFEMYLPGEIDRLKICPNFSPLISAILDFIKQEKVFSKIEKYKPTLWERIGLWFAKPYYGVDLGCGKYKSVEVKCKKFRGKIYILEAKET